MDKKIVLQIDDELVQKETKNGTRYFIGKSQPDLRFTDASILVPPVIGINHYVKNLEALYGTLDTIQLMEYAVTLVKDRVGTAKEVLDETE